MSTKGFSLAFIAVTLAILAVVGLFNRIVDPYWYFREVEIVGFNHVKPHAVGNERLVKPALVNKLSPDVIILGNSVAEIGLPPTHRGLTNDGTLKCVQPGAAGSELDRGLLPCDVRHAPNDGQTADHRYGRRNLGRGHGSLPDRRLRSAGRTTPSCCFQEPR